MNKVIKKIGAIGLGALMAGATLAAGVLAATKLSDFPGFLGEPGTDFWIVVGKDAAASDVVGAVDIAARLAELSTVEKNVPSVTTANIEGKDLEMAFGDKFSAYRTEFKQAQVPFLWDGKITYDDEEYRTYEKIIVDGNTQLMRDPGQFNGTTYLQLPTEKPIQYVYYFADEFDKELSVEKPLVISIPV
ncbi:MAG: S-layer protein, partial [Candidatus Aenigmarchaeota archaeon]|nr:S-layer protein [Candidatus Aenigmarchaeota archaeon]